MSTQPTAFARAVAHSSGMPAGARSRFLEAFRDARRATVLEEDTEARFLSMFGNPAISAAVLAGWIEGEASTRRCDGTVVTS